MQGRLRCDYIKNNSVGYFNFSIKNQVPVVTFSEHYLAKGAAVSLDVDRTDMCRQAGELATTVLNSGSRFNGTSLAPTSVKIHNNGAVLQKLGIKMPTSLFRLPPTR